MTCSLHAGPSPSRIVDRCAGADPRSAVAEEGAPMTVQPTAADEVFRPTTSCGRLTDVVLDRESGHDRRGTRHSRLRRAGGGSVPAPRARPGGGPAAGDDHQDAAADAGDHLAVAAARAALGAGARRDLPGHPAAE